MPPRQRSVKDTGSSKVETAFIRQLARNGCAPLEAWRTLYPRSSQATAKRRTEELIATSPRVQAAIAGIQQRAWQQQRMVGAESLAGISKIARADITKLFDPVTNSLLKVSQWPLTEAFAVRSVRLTRHGVPCGVELYNKFQALELLAFAGGYLTQGDPEARAPDSVVYVLQTYPTPAEPLTLEASAVAPRDEDDEPPDAL